MGHGSKTSSGPFGSSASTGSGPSMNRKETSRSTQSNTFSPRFGAMLAEAGASDGAWTDASVELVVTTSLPSWFVSLRYPAEDALPWSLVRSLRACGQFQDRMSEQPLGTCREAE